MVPSCPVRRTSYGQKTEKKETRNLTPYGQGTGQEPDRNRTYYGQGTGHYGQGTGHYGHPTDTRGHEGMHIGGHINEFVADMTTNRNLENQDVTNGANAHLGRSSGVLGQI